MAVSFAVAHQGMRLAGDGWPNMPRHKHNRKFGLGLDYTACTRVQSRGTGRRHGLVRLRRLMLVRVRVRMRAQVRPGRERPWLVGSVLSVWVPTANQGSACTRRNKVDTMQSKERARRSRQRHLQDDRHGSKASTQATAGLRGGAMRATDDRATRERTRLGHPWLEDRVHSKVKGMVLTLGDHRLKRWASGKRRWSERWQ
jgi:hypothetical protein